MLAFLWALGCFRVRNNRDVSIIWNWLSLEIRPQRWINFHYCLNWLFRPFGLRLFLLYFVFVVVSRIVHFTDIKLRIHSILPLLLEILHSLKIIFDRFLTVRNTQVYFCRVWRGRRKCNHLLCLLIAIKKIHFLNTQKSILRANFNIILTDWL